MIFPLLLSPFLFVVAYGDVVLRLPKEGRCPLLVTGIDETFFGIGVGSTSKLHCLCSLERDDDLAYLLIALKIPIGVSGSFEWEGAVHMWLEQTIREVHIHVPLHAI
jgi:hypothetical protein